MAKEIKYGSEARAALGANSRWYNISKLKLRKIISKIGGNENVS